MKFWKFSRCSAHKIPFETRNLRQSLCSIDFLIVKNLGLCKRVTKKTAAVNTLNDKFTLFFFVVAFDRLRLITTTDIFYFFDFFAGYFIWILSKLSLKVKVS